MKSKLKLTMKIIIFLSIVVFIAILLLIPPVAERASRITGIASDKIKSFAGMVAAAGIGLILVNFGVGALAVVPVVGVALILIGLAVTAWAVYPLFSKPKATMTTDGATGLNKMVA